MEKQNKNKKGQRTGEYCTYTPPPLHWYHLLCLTRSEDLGVILGFNKKLYKGAFSWKLWGMSLAHQSLCQKCSQSKVHDMPENVNYKCRISLCTVDITRFSKLFIRQTCRAASSLYCGFLCAVDLPLWRSSESVCKAMTGVEFGFSGPSLVGSESTGLRKAVGGNCCTSSHHQWRSNSGWIDPISRQGVRWQNGDATAPQKHQLKWKSEELHERPWISDDSSSLMKNKQRKRRAGHVAAMDPHCAAARSQGSARRSVWFWRDVWKNKACFEKHQDAGWHSSQRRCWQAGKTTRGRATSKQ